MPDFIRSAEAWTASGHARGEYRIVSRELPEVATCGGSRRAGEYGARITEATMNFFTLARGNTSPKLVCGADRARVSFVLLVLLACTGAARAQSGGEAGVDRQTVQALLQRINQLEA